MFWVSRILLTDSEREFSLSSEGSPENSQTEQSKFPQSKRTKKRNFEDKHLISMDKREKREVYSWPQSKSL